MSVPKSSVLSCSKGFLAKVGANMNSPKQTQTQSQNVNVVVNPYDQISVKYPEVTENNTNSLNENVVK